jgi:hypothetical protein
MKHTGLFEWNSGTTEEVYDKLEIDYWVLNIGYSNSTLIVQYSIFIAGSIPTIA